MTFAKDPKIHISEVILQARFHGQSFDTLKHANTWILNLFGWRRSDYIAIYGANTLMPEWINLIWLNPWQHQSTGKGKRVSSSIALELSPNESVVNPILKGNNSLLYLLEPDDTYKKINIIYRIIIYIHIYIYISLSLFLSLSFQRHLSSSARLKARVWPSQLYIYICVCIYIYT